MAYIIINSDNTLNFLDNHPKQKGLDTSNGAKLIEFPDKTAEELIGDIKPIEAYWDGEKIIRDPWLVENDRIRAEKAAALKS